MLHSCLLNVLNNSSGRQMFPAFPYEPYDIQRRFMESMYATLETGGVGLFESPTGALLPMNAAYCCTSLSILSPCAGTGTTLSRICSVLQWLEDRQKTVDRAADQQGDPMCIAAEWTDEVVASSIRNPCHLMCLAACCRAKSSRVACYTSMYSAEDSANCSAQKAAAAACAT